MSGLKVIEVPEGIYEKLVREGKASFHTTNQDDYYQTDDNSLVGIRGKKRGDVIVCEIIDIKVRQTDEKSILLSLEKT
jgi:hypothetical protein